MRAPAIICLFLLTGCASRPSEQLSVEDFGSGDPQASPSVVRPMVVEQPRVEPPAASIPHYEQSVLGADDGEPILDVTVQAGDPQIGSAQPVERAVLVDAAVGQINGEPVFAARFLSEMDSRFQAEAQRLAPNQWLTMAEGEIRRALDDLITKHLLVHEALASLTPREEEGLRYMIERVRDNLRSRNRGSEAITNEQLQEFGGWTEEEYLRLRREAQLVQIQLSREIDAKVQVSRRDIQREYNRRYKEFNPDPLARFRLIRVATSREDDVSMFNEALGSGTPFAELAALSQNTYEPESGGLYERPFEGRFDAAEFWALEELNAPARELSPGSHTAPILFGGRSGDTFTAWIFLELIEQPAARSLEQVQLQLEDELRAAKRGVLIHEYVTELRRRGNFTDVDDMVNQLLQYAAQRHLG